MTNVAIKILHGNAVLQTKQGGLVLLIFLVANIL